jgi:hypothetical protein
MLIVDVMDEAIEHGDEGMSIINFKICNQIKLVCFLNFVVHEINSEMIEPEIVVSTEREKADVVDADAAVG